MIHWTSGICPSSSILISIKHNIQEEGSVSVLRRWEGDTCSGPVTDGKSF
jgi:hypothetical protein